MVGKVVHDKIKEDNDFHVALLHLAVKEGDILAVKDITRNAEWVNASDRTGRNCLHWAVAFGTKEACELILSRIGDAGITHADKVGRTPLHFAAIWGRSDIAKMILSRGAQVNVTDRKCMTPMHYAAQNSNPFLIRSLVKRGADKNARDSRKRTPYQVAVQWVQAQKILDLLDPEFSAALVNRVPEMPQARRFAESLSPRAHEGIQVQPFGATVLKDFPAELVKLDMQKQSDKTRTMLQKVVVKKMKKLESPGEHQKDFALKALAARRRKIFVESQMKKLAEQKRLQQSKENKPGASLLPTSASSSPMSSPRRGGKMNKGRSFAGSSLLPSPRKGKKALVSSRSGSPGKSSRANSPEASRHVRDQTYSRPNTPHGFMSPLTKPIIPNPGARDGWPSPPGSFHGNGRKDGGGVVILKPRWRAQPIRMPSPARRALHEFVGTSERHNFLGTNQSPAVHKCVDLRKLQNQWL